MESQNQSDKMVIYPTQEVLQEVEQVILDQGEGLCVISNLEEDRNFASLPSLGVDVRSKHHPSFCVCNFTWLDLMMHFPFLPR